jgi:hypothetical protein
MQRTLVFHELAVARNLKRARARDKVLVLDRILHCSQAVAHRVLDLRQRVLVRTCTKRTSVVNKKSKLW